MDHAYRRRSVLAGLAGAGLVSVGEWLARDAWAEATAAPAGVPAQAPPVRTRYDVNSRQGQRMLQAYRGAVQKMMQRPEKDPCSWVFQWYTHFTKGSTTKDAEIRRIFGAGASPAKSLAQAMWDTCQAHGGQAPQDESWFLPWHRMYVHQFETIIRKVSGDSGFTLPYWNYSAANSREMPAAFRQRGSPLYRTNRNAGPNGRAPIPASQVALTALAETSYDPVGVAPGFDQAIDFGIHGNVHVWVGNTQGMGDIPWAAFDPIFWMHHCNIDRLWASWNRGGRANPGGAWAAQQFTFADADCRQVLARIGEVDDIAKLHYTYDRFETVPEAPRLLAQSSPVVRFHSVAPPTVAATSKGGIALQAGPTRVALQPAAPLGQPEFQSHVRALPPGRRTYLVLRDASADAQPGTVYDLYLDLPPDARPSPEGPHHVGVINFFAAAGMPGMPGRMQRNFSLNVTEQVRGLAAGGQLTNTPSLVIIPAARANEAAKPVIGQIQLAEQ